MADSGTALPVPRQDRGRHQLRSSLPLQKEERLAAPASPTRQSESRTSTTECGSSALWILISVESTWRKKLCGLSTIPWAKSVMHPELDTKRAEKNWEHFCGQNGRTEGCADENVQQGVQARSSTQDENVRDHLQFGSRAGRGTEVSLQVERTVAHRGRGSTGSEAGAAA